MTRVALFVIVALIAPHVYANRTDICALKYCTCKPTTHPNWTTVECKVPDDENLNIFEGDIPKTTTDIKITGAEAVLFGVNSLSNMQDLRYISIAGPKLILFRKFAAVNLNVVSVYIEISECDLLRMEEKTFTNIKGPLTVQISYCDFVSIQGEAFSWLLQLTISHVNTLEVGPGAFQLDPNASAQNTFEHGPGMRIDIKNVTIKEFTSQTFGSSAGSISLEAAEVLAIRPQAFTANTYNVVSAVNSTFHLIEGEAFAQKSMINHLQFDGCEFRRLAPGALQSGVQNLVFSHSTFKEIGSGAINVTVASVSINDCQFRKFNEKGFQFSYLSKLQMQRNLFDELAQNAIIAPDASIHEIVFEENEIETVHDRSLAFIGEAYDNSASSVKYKDNYYGQSCFCNITPSLLSSLGTKAKEPFMSESFCTINEFFARCFNVPEQNMVVEKFIGAVCIDDVTLKCEPFISKTAGSTTEIKNPRFPHKKDDEGISERNKKVIGIVIVTTIGCVLIVLIISLIRWMRRKGYCINVKNFLISSNTSCANFCDRICSCGGNNGIDSAGSISQMSVNEYSERRRLNEPTRVQEVYQETTIPDMYAQQVLPVEDKTTQTLPEELTKELLESLRERLDDPENYVEAREMIEHLYELIKVEESCNTNPQTQQKLIEENIYELPFQNTAPRVGKNKKKMISVGTRAPSLDKLLPLSPYNRQTALAHEYFEPKDFAVHLYAEIANSDKEKKNLLRGMPDVVAEQAIPRGPYLRAVREKTSSPSSSPLAKSLSSLSPKSQSPLHMSTIKSNKSTASNSSGKMINRPLPEKPFDPGEGTSIQHNV